MAQEPLPLSQPEIEEAGRYRHVVNQKHRFCDKSSVGFFEVYGKQKGDFEELDTEKLLAKLRIDACGESRRGKGDGGELRTRVLYVENFVPFLVPGLPVLANHDEITTFLVNCCSHSFQILIQVHIKLLPPSSFSVFVYSFTFAS
jgi:hypothetical protein